MLSVLGWIGFYPSLAYNLTKNFLQPRDWAWWTRIDKNVLLGALPFQSMVDELKEENVGGVVCCTEEFELNAAYTAIGPAEWKELGVRFHHVPMQDFTGSTDVEHLDAAVRFIDEMAADGKTCYVHCKAGRTRSATVAACYLMRRHDYAPNVAFEALRSERPQVLLRSAHWDSLNQYRRMLDTRQQAS